MIDEYQQLIESQGFDFIYENKKSTIQPTVISAVDSDLTYKIIELKAKETAEKAFSYGHRSNLIGNLIDYYRSFFYGIEITPEIYFDESEMEKVLKNNFDIFDDPAANPKINLTANGQIEVTPEKSGMMLDYREAIGSVKKLIAGLAKKEIRLSLIKDEPTVMLSETPDAQKNLRDIISRNLPWFLSYEDYLWKLELEDITDWFVFSRHKDGSIRPDFSVAEVSNYLNATPGADLNIEPVEGKFTIEDGRVTEFQISQNGKKINLNLTIEQIRLDLLNNKGTRSQIITNLVEPKSVSKETNNLGIKELVGIGQTDFHGSPKNRVHNINVGADKLNGVLIKPGEEFSLVETLGEIDASTGYLPELVIKGNKTIPEYGGGLCQIGTTAFRVVLNAGLPVLERQNHSYRVSYYEPPVGMDATIYNPAPDFKFKNDYASHLLLQTKIEGTILFFELYGTQDGREASTTEPYIYNYTSPGPTKYIETEDLAPGEIKCTEKAHTGADAEFTYTVKYKNGHTADETFKSHYKAWPEVCLIGAEPEKEIVEPEPDTQATDS